MAPTCVSEVPLAITNQSVADDTPRRSSRFTFSRLPSNSRSTTRATYFGMSTDEGGTGVMLIQTTWFSLAKPQSSSPHPGLGEGQVRVYGPGTRECESAKV